MLRRARVVRRSLRHGVEEQTEVRFEAAREHRIWIGCVPGVVGVEFRAGHSRDGEVPRHVVGSRIFDSG